MEPIVIARAPGHISLGSDGTALHIGGGGCDHLTVNAAINYYAYTIISPSRANGVHIMCVGQHGYPRSLPEDDPMWGRELALPKAIARLFGVREGLTIFLSTQVPLGVGLGLSGSLTVSMIKALAFSCGLDLEPTEVAEMACYVREETLRLGSDGQYQYAAACGGLNCIDFTSKHVQVEPVRISPEVRESLEKQLMLFRYDCGHCGPSTTEQQRKPDPVRDVPEGDRARALRENSRNIRYSLERGDLTTLGALLHNSWLEQYRLHEHAEEGLLAECYQTAMDRGALGGKQISADNRGFLLLLCPEANQQPVTDSLAALGLRRWPLALEDEGVQVMEAMPWAKLTSISSVREPIHLGSHFLHPR